MLSTSSLHNRKGVVVERGMSLLMLREIDDWQKLLPWTIEDLPTETHRLPGKEHAHQRGPSCHECVCLPDCTVSALLHVNIIRAGRTVDQGNKGYIAH